jgi:hypothetical protein
MFDSLIKSRRIGWEEHVARIRKISRAYKILVGKPEGERPLRVSSLIKEDNIKM